MAGEDDAERVRSERGADRPRGAGAAEGGGEGAIRRGLPVGDALGELAEYLGLEPADERPVDVDVEALAAAGEVIVELAADAVNAPGTLRTLGEVAAAMRSRACDSAGSSGAKGGDERAGVRDGIEEAPDRGVVEGVTDVGGVEDGGGPWLGAGSREERRVGPR